MVDYYVARQTVQRSHARLRQWPDGPTGSKKEFQAPTLAGELDFRPRGLEPVSLHANELTGTTSDIKPTSVQQYLHLARNPLNTFIT